FPRASMQNKSPARILCERGEFATLQWKFQKYSFAPSWKILGSKAEVSWPNLLSPRFALTLLNCVWFQVLKLSTRNSSRLPRVSLKVKLLKSDMFQLSRPGPRRALWPSVPKAPTAGAVNAVVSNHWATVCG